MPKIKLLPPALAIMLCLGAPARAVPPTPATDVVVSPAIVAPLDVDAAEARLRAGDVEGALAGLHAWLQAHPGDVAAHELQIDLLVQTGQGERAVAAYTKSSPLPRGSADAEYLAGRASVDPEAAETHFRAALSREPGHARAHMGLGAVLRATGDGAGALAEYQAAVGADPTLVEAWSGMVVILDRDGRSDDAVHAARQLIEAAPTSAEGYLLLAALRPGDARATLDTAVKYAGDDSRVQQARARVCFEERALDCAAASYDALLAITPGDAAARSERALIGEVQADLLTLDAAAALLNVRETLSRDARTGLATLDAIVEANPQSGWARLVRGNTRSAMHRADAEDDLRAALSRMPTSSDAWSALGLYLLGAHRSDEAALLLTRAADARPWDVSLAVAAGIAVAEISGRDAGEVRLREAMAAFPGEPGPPLALARLLLDAAKPQEAWLVLAMAISRRPDPDLMLALAAASREAGRPEEAARVLDELARQTGDARYAEAAQAIRADANR